MRFLKYWWRRFITLFENLFKKTQKEQDLEAPSPLKEDLDAPAPLKEDLDAPVPANKQNKGNPLFQRDGHLMPSLCDAPINMVIGRVSMKRNSVSIAMANGCVANERHYVSNNIKNIGGNNMGSLQSKVIKFLGGTPAPKSEDECKQQIKELEKQQLKFQNKEGVAPIKPVGQEKILSSNISPISMRSNNDNSNWIDPNDINNTFEYQDEKVQKAMKGENNKMGDLINKKAEKIKQEIKKDMDDRFAESTNKINQIQEQVNKNTEDMKEVNKKVDKIQEEQIDIKKMLAELKEMRKEDKKRYEEDKKKSEENQKAHDEIMAMLWNKLDEWNGIKQPTREGSDNRESTNTSFSSFKYKNPFRNNKRQPRMERPDMAHSHYEN